MPKKSQKPISTGRLVLGSKTDVDNARIVTKIWEEIGLKFIVSIASCHKHGGGEFEEFILEKVTEPIVAFLGGMELAAVGVIETLYRNHNMWGKIVFGIPTDKAARSAIENLPKGVAVITVGLNEISLNHSLTNSALSIAKLLSIQDPSIIPGLQKYYQKMRDENPLIENLDMTESKEG